MHAVWSMAACMQRQSLHRHGPTCCWCLLACMHASCSLACAASHRRTLGPNPCMPSATTTTFSASLSMICSVLSPNTLTITGARPRLALGLRRAFMLLMPPDTVLNWQQAWQPGPRQLQGRPPSNMAAQVARPPRRRPSARPANPAVPCGRLRAPAPALPAAPPSSRCHRPNEPAQAPPASLVAPWPCCCFAAASWRLLNSCCCLRRRASPGIGCCHS